MTLYTLQRTQLGVLFQKLSALLEESVCKLLAFLNQTIFLKNSSSLSDPRLSLVFREFTKDLCAKILRFLLKPLGRVLSIRASRVYTRLRKSSNNLPLPVASRSLASFSSAAAFSNSLFKLSISVFSAIIDNPANREKCNDYRKTLEQNPNYGPLLTQLWAHRQMRDSAHFQILGGWNDTLGRRNTNNYFLICSCSRSVLDQHKGACSADSL